MKLAAAAPLLLAVLLAPSVHAEPLQSDDYQYCAHVSAEMGKHPSTQGTTVSDCGFISAVGRSECQFFRFNRLDIDIVMKETEAKYNWDSTMAAVVLAYAVYDYCREFEPQLASQGTPDGKTPGTVGKSAAIV
jgi:hypothetical protein